VSPQRPGGRRPEIDPSGRTIGSSGGLTQSGGCSKRRSILATVPAAPTPLGVRARLPPKNGSDTPPKYVFSPFSLYLQCILSAIHPLYLRHSDVLYRCVFSRYVVRYRSGIGLHAWCLHVLSIQYMRLYRRFSILNDTHRYMTSLSPLPRGCCACVSIQEAPSCILTYLCLTNECIFLCPRP
jgi:hypothetical protein